MSSASTNVSSGPDFSFCDEGIRSVRRRIHATTKKLDDKLDQLKAKANGEHSGRNRSQRASLESHQSTELVGLALQDAMPAAEAAKVSASSTDDPQKLSRKSSASSRKKERKSSSPRIPTFDAPAPAVKDSDTSDDEEDENDHAFDHPSTYADQVSIWIPKDILGLSNLLVKDLKDVGIDASDVGASMDAKGVVEVTRNPPDEEWDGGHDL